MVRKLVTFVRRSRFVIAGALFALSVATAGSAALTTGAASAEACTPDPVNIILCGLDQRSLQSDINSFQASYQSGSNSGHNDLKAVYRWAGATDTSVNGMTTANTKLGTLAKDGMITVGGKVVGSQAAVAARFGAGQPGFHPIPGSNTAYWRLTTTSFAENSAPVIVHFASDGTADFAVMTGCGNAVKFPPKPPAPQPKPQLTCVNLNGSEVGTTRRYNFTAHAKATDTTITKYVFDFDDHVATDKVTTSGATATSSHTYSNDGQSFKARVTVFSKDFPNGVTSGDCAFQAKTPTPKPSLTCDQLAVDVKGLNYTFTATASATNTTIKSYAFHLSDQSQPVIVNTSARLATIKHSFAKNSTQYTVFVIVKSDKLTTAQTMKCTKTFKTPRPSECKPGVPKGDKRCSECLPGVQEGSPECTPTPLTPTSPPPAELSHTGSATGAVIGIFGASVFAGTLGHRLLMRRKYGL